MTVAAGTVAAFVVSLIDNDEKVASSKKKTTQFKTSVQKPYHTYHNDQNNQNRFPIYGHAKQLKNPTL